MTASFKKGNYYFSYLFFAISPFWCGLCVCSLMATIHISHRTSYLLCLTYPNLFCSYYVFHYDVVYITEVAIFGLFLLFGKLLMLLNWNCVSSFFFENIFLHNWLSHLLKSHTDVFPLFEIFLGTWSLLCAPLHRLLVLMSIIEIHPFWYHLVVE